MSNDNFYKLVRDGKIKQPNQRGFDLERWNKIYNKSNNKTKKDDDIYKAGIIVNDLLSQIRINLDSFYLQAPRIANERIYRSFVALSNRDQHVVMKNLSTPEKGCSIYSASTSKNIMGNKVLLKEVAEGSIDGLSNAIHHWFHKKDLDEKRSPPENSIEPIDYIIYESYYSQLYNNIVSLWHAILWSEFIIEESKSESNHYIIKQPLTDIETKHISSLLRKEKLTTQNLMLLYNYNFHGKFNHDVYITTLDGKILSKKISDATEDIQLLNLSERLKILSLRFEFTDEQLNFKVVNNISISDLLESFRCLTILSHELSQKFPVNDGVQNINKLIQFSPQINKIELKSALAKALDKSFTEASEMVDFLTYTGQSKEEIWCHPILEYKNEKLLISTSSLASPLLTRVVEHWLVELKFDLQGKGMIFEKNVLEEINNALKINEIINAYENAKSKRIKLTNTEEEIDVIFIVANKIFIGECKSIVSTDSPISQYRTLEILQHAADQVNRKIKFVKNNIKDVFNSLEWSYDESIDYTFSGFIITSNRILVGTTIESIPVIDVDILKKYLSTNFFPLISNIKENETIHYAWYTLYSSEIEFCDNFETYLTNPPQINYSISHFEYETIEMPKLDGSAYSIEYQRLMPKKLDIDTILNSKHHFTLHKSDDFESAISSLDFLA